MWKNLSAADLFAIAANLLPVYGVWALGWNPREIFLIYCLESLIIGFFTLVKMGITTSVKKKDVWENNGSKTIVHGTFFMFFFLIHYGFFMIIQIFIFSKSMSLSGKEMSVWDFLFHWPQYLGTEGYVVLGIFILAYGYKNLSGFILSGEYKTAVLSSIMFEPYIRVFIQQITVILGSFVLLFNGGKVFILLFAFIRIYFEVILKYDVRIKEALKAKSNESNKKIADAEN